MKNAECYYVEYGVCSCNSSKNCDKRCVGSAECPNFISGDDYFSGMISGTIKETVVTEDPAKRRERINKNLSLGKTKKQLKHDRMEEQKQYGDGTGYALKDDPRFKDLFGNIK